MNTFSAELQAALGTCVTTDPQICRAYDHDLGEMPRLLLGLFRRTPDAVLLARSAEDIASALTIARKYSVPVTVRAQASSGYGGAMPVRGGLLVDVSRMKAILAIDEKAGTCDVEPGVVWTDLDEELALKGLASRICPTSGPSSTVGGMFAMGGFGIGSFRYGSILDAVSEIDVVNPDGKKTLVRGVELADYAFSQGCLGIITRLRLQTRKLVPLQKIAFGVRNLEQIPSLLESLARLGAYSVSLLSAEYLAMQEEACRQGLAAVTAGALVLAVFESAPGQAAIQACCRNGTRLLPEVEAVREWDGRYYPMRIKRNGPALLVGEYLVAASRFVPVWERISRRLAHDRVGFEAFACRDGRISVLVYILDSAEDLLSLVRMGKAMVPLHAATAFGGTVYATGLWFNSRTKSVLGRERYRRLLRRKKALDPKNLMNSGKCCGGLRGFLPFALLSEGIWLATRFMGPLSSLLRARPRRFSGHREG